MTKEQWELLDVHLMRLNHAASTTSSEISYLQTVIRNLHRNRESRDIGYEFRSLQQNFDQIHTLLQECLDELEEVKRATQNA